MKTKVKESRNQEVCAPLCVLVVSTSLAKCGALLGEQTPAHLLLVSYLILHKCGLGVGTL